MKLRIRGNTLRLRLSQGEVIAFSEAGLLENSVQFGPEAGQRLVYSLIASAEHDKLAVLYERGHIAVLVPQDVARQWAETEQVGFEGIHSVGEGAALEVLVEKDFKCILPREGEDDDGFPNPGVGD